jgi:hypothetical protein
MSALNYTVFVYQVEAGLKRQTIRATRKHPIKVGERLHHFTGMRTKKCRRLRDGIEDRCIRVRDIEMTFVSARSMAGVFTCFSCEIRVDGKRIYQRASEIISRHDGFGGLGAFLRFFFQATKPARRKKGTTKFKGQIINW